MPEQPSSHRDISAVYEERRKTRDAEIGLYNQVEAAIRGHLPDEYNRLFAQADVKLQIRTLRAADDALTKFLSEIPILPRAEIKGKRDSDTARNKAETAEKIAYTWYNGSALRGGVEFDGITFQLARHQVRFGDGCLLIHPDHERRIAYLEAKDPRCHYPPTGWHPWSLTALDGTLLVYEMTLGEVKRRFAYDSYGMAKTDVLARLNNVYRPTYGYAGGFEVDDSQIARLGAYRSREAWFIVCMGHDTDVVLAESQSGDRKHPGVCGVVSFKQFASDPLFLGQIGIEAGLMKVLNQQIQNTDRINNAPIVGPPLLGDELIWGAYNALDPTNPSSTRIPVQRIAPDSPNNLTQVMGSLLSLAQMFNYNPESNMGGGPANSGKAIQQLQAGPRSLVTNILWSPYKVAFPRVHDDCLEMELNLWPNEKKRATGRKGRQTFEVDYTPSAALGDYKGGIKIEEARLGGYNAFLEALQKKDAGMSSLRSVLEKDPDIRDVENEIRRIESEATERQMNAAFEALASQNPGQAIIALARKKALIESGKTSAEAIQTVLEEGLLQPPAPEPEMAPSMPPELQALMGGGGAPELPPALSEIQAAM